MRRFLIMSNTGMYKNWSTPVQSLLVSGAAAEESDHLGLIPGAPEYISLIPSQFFKPNLPWGARLPPPTES